MDKTDKGIPAADIEWSRKLAMSINYGGVWGVPHSGLIMRRNTTGFVLESVMPFTEIEGAAELGRDVPATADELLSYQRAGFATMGSRFEAAGFTFTDPEGLLS